jgi:hypothetical protein
MQLDAPRSPSILGNHFQNPKPKNKSEIRGAFFKPELGPSTSHDPPRIHHKFTIKKPRFTTRFCQNPLQNDEIFPSQKIRTSNSNPASNPARIESLTPMGY